MMTRLKMVMTMNKKIKEMMEDEDDDDNEDDEEEEENIFKQLADAAG